MSNRSASDSDGASDSAGGAGGGAGAGAGAGAGGRADGGGSAFEEAREGGSTNAAVVATWDFSCELWGFTPSCKEVVS